MPNDYLTHTTNPRNHSSSEAEPGAPNLHGGGCRSRNDPLAGGPLAVETREIWSRRFGRTSPIEIEIGFGYGRFLLEHASRHPEISIVGLEVRKFLAAHVQQRATRLGLNNVAVLRGDARRLLPVLFARGEVRAVHIQFPDPWWKKKHHRRRLIDPPFVTLLHGLLEPNGQVDLRTDVLEYGQAMIEAFEDGTDRFENSSGPRTFAAEDPINVPSNRERRYLESETPVYRLSYRRKRIGTLQE